MSTNAKRFAALLLCVAAFGWSMATEAQSGRRIGIIRMLARLGLRAVALREPTPEECVVLHQHTPADEDGGRIINHGDWW